MYRKREPKYSAYFFHLHKSFLMRVTFHSPELSQDSILLKLLL